MKFLVFPSILSLLLSTAVIGQPAPISATPPPSADQILKEAYSTATKENKNVLIMFHASWCIWCHRMDSSLQDPACRKFFDDNFVIRHLVVDESKDKQNLENPGADEMRRKYYGDGQGIPFWLIFNKEGKLLADSKMRKEGEGPEAGQNTGCPASEAEVAYFIDVLKKTTRFSPEQEEAVRKRFRQNEQ